MGLETMTAVLLQISLKLTENLKGHQIMGSFGLLGSIIGDLILSPEGKEQLQRILAVSLDAVDSNDKTKTMEALKIFYSILLHEKTDRNRTVFLHNLGRGSLGLVYGFA